jgi:adenosylcobinamide-GDP ribazoletransferase
MSNSDTWIPKWGDIPAAIGLLSRLPISVDMHKAQARGAHPSWAYGLAGALFGALAALAGWAGLVMGLPSLATGLLVVGTTAWITGAMHHDGLADSLDGLWGGWSLQQRLDIMKDSHIGVYGVVGLICAIGLQATLYGHLAAQSLWPIPRRHGGVSRHYGANYGSAAQCPQPGIVGQCWPAQPANSHSGRGSWGDNCNI